MSSQNVTTIHIETGTPYDVVLGSGIFDDFGPAFTRVCPHAHTVAIVTDDMVARFYFTRMQKILKAQNLRCIHVIFPHGEAQKNIATWEHILRVFADNNLTRSDAVVALGGGVVGDMAGFAAASYMRGIDVVQVPTSLLADVDSSVGGKTAVDLPEGKNLVGAFWQPKLVWADVDCLDTLAHDFQIDGMGEVLKCGVLQGGSLFELAQKNRTEDRLELISACIRLKDHYVSEDEKENGARRFLNLGHTFGHAIETLSEFTITHGKCVAIGLILMARACEAKGIAVPGTTRRIHDAVENIGLPTKTTFGPDEIVEAARHDKKSSDTHITVVLIEDIGKCSLKTITFDELSELAHAALS